jgi:hypothetical protein
MKKKEINKVIVAVIAVALVIAIVGGSTFAYWQWVTATNQQTAVNVTVKDGISMKITPSTTQTNVLYPVTDANCGLASITGQALVEVTNNTGVEARPQLYLKIKITSKEGNDITTTYAKHIKYAVSEFYQLDGSGNEIREEEGQPKVMTSGYTCVTAPRQGRFDPTIPTLDQFGNPVSPWRDSPILTNLTDVLDADDQPITDETHASRYPILPSESGNDNSITFNVAPNSEVSHTFAFWAWIDSAYTAENTGNVVSDPLQDAKITISWSDASIVKQGA